MPDKVPAIATIRDPINPILVGWSFSRRAIIIRARNRLGNLARRPQGCRALGTMFVCI